MYAAALHLTLGDKFRLASSGLRTGFKSGSRPQRMALFKVRCCKTLRQNCNFSRRATAA
jgi:hypothetical protein